MNEHLYSIFGGYPGVDNTPDEIITRHTLLWYGRNDAEKILQDREKAKEKQRQAELDRYRS